MCEFCQTTFVATLILLHLELANDNQFCFKVEMKEETYMSSSEDIVKKIAKESILKRIPEGAEAAAVLVGAVDFLEQPTTAFIRLAEGTVIPTVTEVLYHTRFNHIIVGRLYTTAHFPASH